MPTDKAVEMLRLREGETHTQGDIHEVDTAYLAQCRRVAAKAAGLCGWHKVSCVDAKGGIRAIEDIHEEIWNTVSSITTGR